MQHVGRVSRVEGEYRSHLKSSASTGDCGQKLEAVSLCLRHGTLMSHPKP